jgi:DNA repair protein RadC
MTLQKLHSSSAHDARALVTLRGHLGDGAANAIVAAPAVVLPKGLRKPWWRRPPRPAADKRAGICYWPESERPRERLFEKGADALSDAELIALLLGTGTRGRSAVDIARSLLDEFGSLRELLRSDPSRWQNRAGIGPAKYAVVLAAMEIARRNLKDQLKDTPILDTPDRTREFLLAQLEDRPYEAFCCIFLDARNRMLAFEEICKGTIHTASLYPREIARRVLAYNAISIIAAHNHPSGCSDPSMADERMTQRLREALALIEVRLVDHFVVGDGKCYSFSEHGLL